MARGDNLRNRGPQYDAKQHPLLAKWVTRSGGTLPQVAKEIGVSLSTLKRWMKLHDDLRASIARAREEDQNVEDSLYRRANGYDYTEQKVIMKTVDGKQVVEKIERVTKHVAPDPHCLQFWLRNRKPKTWRNTPMPNVTENDLVTTDQALVGAQIPSGAVPPLEPPSAVQDGPGRPPVGKDRAGQATSGAQPVGLPGASPSLG